MQFSHLTSQYCQVTATKKKLAHLGQEGDAPKGKIIGYSTKKDTLPLSNARLGHLYKQYRTGRLQGDPGGYANSTRILAITVSILGTQKEKLLAVHQGSAQV